MGKLRTLETTLLGEEAGLVLPKQVQRQLGGEGRRGKGNERRGKETIKLRDETGKEGRGRGGNKGFSSPATRDHTPPVFGENDVEKTDDMDNVLR